MSSPPTKLRQMRLSRSDADMEDQAEGVDTVYEPYRHVGANAKLLPETAQQQPRRYPSTATGTAVLGAVLTFSLAALATRVYTVVIFNTYKNHRMLWQHGLALRAWPAMEVIPVYSSIGLAGLTAISSITLLALTRKKAHGRQNRRSRPVALPTLGYILLAAAWTAVVLVNVLVNPNVLRWSCLNNQYKAPTSNNDAGLAPVCATAIAGEAASGAVVLIALGQVLVTLVMSVSSRGMRRSPRMTVQSIGGYYKLGKIEDEHADVSSIPPPTQ